MLFKIYGLYSDDKIRYIGQTRFTLNKRLSEHLRDKKINKRTSWIKSLLNSGNTLKIVCLDECSSIEEANLLEVTYINLFKSFGANLVNGTIGGIAPMKDKKHSEEFKKKRSQDMLGENNPFYGKKHSKATLDKLSTALKGRNVWSKGKTFTETHKNKIAKALLGRLPHNANKSRLDSGVIFALYKDGLTQKQIATKLNCDPSNISRILNNKYENKKRKSVSKVSAS